MPIFVQSTERVRGTWAATAGAQRTFQGGWTATIRVQTPDVAQGAWTLFGPSNQVAAEGTWSAQKLSGSWQGTWAARGPGRVLTGTWQARVSASSVKTLVGMLQQSLKEQIGGTWRSGRFQGNWSIRGAP